MRTRLCLALAIVVLSTGIGGCLRGPLSWQRISLNQPIAQQDVGFIIDGTTSLSDVVSRLGSPDDLQPAGSSLIVRYHFSDGKYFRADYGWGLRFLVPFLAPDLVLGGGGFGTDTFQLTCDPQLIVREHAFAWHANSSKFRFWPFGETP